MRNNDRQRRKTARLLEPSPIDNAVEGRPGVQGGGRRREPRSLAKGERAFVRKRFGAAKWPKNAV